MRVAVGPVREGKTIWAAVLCMRRDRRLRASRVWGAHCRAASFTSQAGCAAKARRLDVVGTPAGPSCPVPAIVYPVVPVGPGHVEGPVPDPSSGEAGAASHLAVGLGDPDLRPDGAECVGTVALGQTDHPAVTRIDHPRTLCSVQDIPPYGLNHIPVPIDPYKET